MRETPRSCRRAVGVTLKASSGGTPLAAVSGRETSMRKSKARSGPARKFHRFPAADADLTIFARRTRPSPRPRFMFGTLRNPSPDRAGTGRLHLALAIKRGTARSATACGRMAHRSTRPWTGGRAPALHVGWRMMSSIAGGGHSAHAPGTGYTGQRRAERRPPAGRLAMPALGLRNPIVANPSDQFKRGEIHTVRTQR